MKKPTPTELAKQNRHAIRRVLSTSGEISRTDRDAVLLAASEALAQMRDTSFPSSAALFAAALVCRKEPPAPEKARPMLERVG